jgi:hypothetical protein
MVWTSLFGIITIVLLARALGFANAPRLADAAAARQLASEALFDFRADEAVVDARGRGALVAGTDGSVALVRPLGDRWVVRIVNGAAAELSGTRLRVQPAEAMFPPAELDLGPAAARWAARLA